MTDKTSLFKRKFFLQSLYLEDDDKNIIMLKKARMRRCYFKEIYNFSMYDTIFKKETSFGQYISKKLLKGLKYIDLMPYNNSYWLVAMKTAQNLRDIAIYEYWDEVGVMD